MSHRPDTTKPLESFCQNRSSFKTKVALMTFYGLKYSFWTEKIIVLLEYLQLVSLSILIFPNLTTNFPLSDKFVPQAIIYACKLVNPSYLIDYTESRSLTSTILILLLCYTIFKLLLFFYILFRAFKRNKQAFSGLVTIWQWIFKLQGPIGYYFMTSFWVRAILENDESGYSLFEMSSTANKGIAGLTLKGGKCF